MQNYIAVAVDLSSRLIEAWRQEAYNFQDWNNVAASDALCVTLNRKWAEDNSRKAANKEKIVQRNAFVNFPTGLLIHSKTCSASVKTCYDWAHNQSVYKSLACSSSETGLY